MSNHDKINYAIKLHQKAQLKSASVLKSMEYIKEWNNLCQILNEMERQTLEQLMRINEGKPKLSLDSIEEFLERFLVYKKKKDQKDELIFIYLYFLSLEKSFHFV